MKIYTLPQETQVTADGMLIKACAYKDYTQVLITMLDAQLKPRYALKIPHDARMSLIYPNGDTVSIPKGSKVDIPERPEKPLLLIAMDLAPHPIIVFTRTDRAVTEQYHIAIGLPWYSLEHVTDLLKYEDKDISSPYQSDDSYRASDVSNIDIS